MGALSRTRDKAYWESKNFILAPGEVGFEDETGKSKIGDGITRWNALSYSSYPAFAIPQVDSVETTQSHDTDTERESFVPARLSDVNLKITFVPFWKPSTAVSSGDVRMTALGLTITRNSNGTTRATFDSTEAALWTVSSGSGGGGSTTDASLLTSGTLAVARIADGSLTAAKMAGDVATQAELDAASTADRARSNHTGTQAASTITGLATVATTGNYADLSGTPATTLTQTTQTGTTYTLVLADANTLVELNNAAAITVTVPPNSSVAFPVGTTIGLRQYGAGQVTVAAGAGVTIRSRSAAFKTSGQYAEASLTKRATDEWVLAGDLAV